MSILPSLAALGCGNLQLSILSAWRRGRELQGKIRTALVALISVCAAAAVVAAAFLTLEHSCSSRSLAATDKPTATFELHVSEPNKINGSSATEDGESWGHK